MCACVNLSSKAFTLLKKVIFSSSISENFLYRKSRNVALTIDVKRKNVSFSIFSDRVCGVKVTFDSHETFICNCPEDTTFVFNMLPLKNIKVSNSDIVQFDTEDMKANIISNLLKEKSNPTINQSINLDNIDTNMDYTPYPSAKSAIIGSINMDALSFTLLYMDKDAKYLSETVTGALEHYFFLTKQDERGNTHIIATNRHDITNVQAYFKGILKEDINVRYTALHILSDFTKPSGMLLFKRADKYIFIEGIHSRTGAVIETVYRLYDGGTIKYDKIIPQEKTPVCSYSITYPNLDKWITELEGIKKSNYYKKDFIFVTLGKSCSKYISEHGEPSEFKDMTLPQYVTKEIFRPEEEKTVGIDLAYLINALKTIKNIKTDTTTVISIYDEDQPVVVRSGVVECGIMPVQIIN